MRSTFTILLVVLAAEQIGAAEVDYLRDVKPLLSRRCYACHGAVRQKAKLRLDAASLLQKGGKHGPVVVPGKSDASVLIEAVMGKDRPRMPPEREGTGLDEKEIALLRAWIDQGAHMPEEAIPGDPRDHWAFRPPVRPALPRCLAESPWANPIDAFVAAQRERQGVKANPTTDRAVLLRRVFLDLIGLPPTRQELHAFLTDDRPDAYEKVVDRLLASPRYGERWGRHWMDVWRYSDPFGLGEEYRYSQRHIWRWRDWIIESLNADKGYDRMIVEMLAGDELAPADPDTLRATGYLARNWYKYNRNAWIQDTVEYTAAGFLGLTLRCARCHDHKYDPIAQQDYYRFRAFFEPHDIRIDPVPGQPDTNKDGVARAYDAHLETPTYLFRRGDERTPDKSRALTPAVPAVLGGEPVVRPVRFTVHDYAQALAPAINAARRLARNEVAQAEAAARSKQSEPEVERSAKQLAAACAALVAVEARIAAEKAKFAQPDDQARYQRRALAASKSERQAAVLRAEAKVLQAESEVARADKKTKVAAQKTLAELRKAAQTAASEATKDNAAYTPLVRIDPAGSSGRRLTLARWITDRGNPLTARVAVNHVWMRHFGKPLVPTVANFGLNGKPPTHPQLLDWLAVEFMESGWSMKHLHRLIVTSHTYRLSSRNEPASLATDPENHYLWRMNPRRIEAEAVRDSLLTVAAHLDPTQGGPILDEKSGQTSRRRSLYFRFNTEYRMRFLDQFDPASPTECYERRESVLPQQALTLLNSSLALNQSRSLAKRLTAETVTVEAFVTAAFEQVLSRPPTETERSRCMRFLREQAELVREPGKLTPFPPGPDTVTPPAADPAQRARESLLLVLLNHNDFVTIH
jgi:hypothetical protein